MGVKTKMSEPKFCPLCGAHEFEWYEGEEIDEMVLEFGNQIEDLYKKYQSLKNSTDNHT